MNYKTYAEARIANPDCEIVTTGKDWAFEKSLKGVFQALGDSDGLRHSVGDDAWVICNPADYCSTLKEFLDAGFKLVEGDKFIGVSGSVISVKNPSASSCQDDSDINRYILSAAAINGGCKIEFIEHKAESWTTHNNTLPLCELTDEQYGKMRRMHDAGATVQSLNEDGYGFQDCSLPTWIINGVYRIKSKSERELFIETSAKLMTSETERTMEQMFGAQFDAGARYTDLTQYFGENI